MGWLTTTDHKAIGVAYVVTAFVFLAVGGALAGGHAGRSWPSPGCSSSTSDVQQLFTIHGSVMV